MDSKTKKTIATYNRIAEEYAKKISDRARLVEIEKFISYLKPKAKILDIGCAAGRDSRIFKNKGFDVVGIDLSKKLLAIARLDNPDVTFIKADMRKLPFENNNFNAIWANAVLHHLEKKEIETTLKEWQRILSPNGIMYIRTKMGKGIWKGKDSLSIGEEREFTLLTSKELESMLTKSGLKKIEIYQTKDKTRDLLWINAFYRKLK